MENTSITERDDVVIRFSGDSGDGMQLTGTLFSDTAAFRLSRIILPKFAHRRELWPVYRDFRYISATIRYRHRVTIATCW